jgi:hypothetical protein
VTHNSTRKQFFSKLLGVVAGAGVLPKLFAKSTSSNLVSSTSAVSKPAGSPFEIRHDARAVARRDLA